MADCHRIGVSFAESRQGVANKVSQPDAPGWFFKGNVNSSPLVYELPRVPRPFAESIGLRGNSRGIGLWPCRGQCRPETCQVIISSIKSEKFIVVEAPQARELTRFCTINENRLIAVCPVKHYYIRKPKKPTPV